MTGETGFKKNSRFEEDQRTVLLFPPVLKITDYPGMNDPVHLTQGLWIFEDDIRS